MITRSSLHRDGGTYEKGNDYNLFVTSTEEHPYTSTSSPKQTKTPLNQHQFKLSSGTIKGALLFKHITGIVLLIELHVLSLLALLFCRQYFLKYMQ